MTRRHNWKMAEREQFPLRPGFKRNQGERPGRSKGKRAQIALMNGELVDGDWSVDTTRWNFTGWWHDVDQYRLM